MSISVIIQNRIDALAHGTVFCANDFVNVGDKGNVDVILHRLSKRNVVRQLGYGLYDIPRKSQLLGDLSPEINDVIDAYSRKMSQHFVLDPLNAANAIGVTIQVPTKLTFLTDGKSRTLIICGVDIKLVHASPKIMTGASTPIGIIIQALRYFGANGAPAGVINSIAKRLSKDDLDALLALRSRMLQNLAQQVNRINQVATIH